MAAISLKLPEDLARTSKEIAEKIGLTRAELIRQALHVSLAARDSLRVQSYALAEHCRSISISRLQSGQIAQLNFDEVSEITHKLKRLIDA